MIEQLLSGNKRIGVWGLGFIGYSTVAYYAKHGVKSIGTDIDIRRIDGINKKLGSIPHMDYWLGFSINPYVDRGMIKATLDWKQLKDCPVHFIAIPTEKNAEPYHNILIDVVKKICTFKNKPLIIIESTLTPGTVEKIIYPLIKKSGLNLNKDIFVGVAPRRDWFTDSHQNLEKLYRVYGASDNKTTKIVGNVVGIVCENLIVAKDCNHACIVKSVENSIRQVEIALGNQLSLAYPDYNMREILKVAGTKWNINTVFPSLGSSGYCVPIAPQYVLAGASKPEYLTILNESIKTDSGMVKHLANKIIKKKYKKIGILGIAYTKDIKVHVLSRSVALVNELKGKAECKIYDPYYTSQEIRNIADVKSFKYPEGLNEFDCIVVVPSHSVFNSTPHKDILNNLKNCKEIIDNEGSWNKINFPKKIKYHLTGDSKWLI